MKRSSAQPVELGIGVGAGLSDHFSVEMHGDDLEYRYTSWDGGEETAVITPNASAWRAFRRTLERLPGWPWEGRFELPPEQFATDGVDWGMTLRYADGTAARCDGYNAFPPNGEGMDPPPAFRRFCRAVSRLVGGREFGWERAATAAPAAAKGSRLRMRQWVENHRDHLERQLREALPTLASFADGPINWLSPLADAGYRELRDDVWQLAMVDPSPQAAGWWPKRGPVWDAAGIVPGREGGLGLVLVEAKGHVAELRSPASKASYESERMIRDALRETKLALGVPESAPWDRTYYQVANRLAFLYWLHAHARRPAWLVNVYFTGDCFRSGRGKVVGPSDEAGWTGPISEAKRTLQLPAEHVLSPWIADVCLPAVLR